LYFSFFCKQHLKEKNKNISNAFGQANVCTTSERTPGFYSIDFQLQEISISSGRTATNMAPKIAVNNTVFSCGGGSDDAYQV